MQEPIAAVIAFWFDIERREMGNASCLVKALADVRFDCMLPSPAEFDTQFHHRRHINKTCKTKVLKGRSHRLCCFVRKEIGQPRNGKVDDKLRTVMELLGEGTNGRSGNLTPSALIEKKYCPVSAFF